MTISKIQKITIVIVVPALIIAGSGVWYFTTSHKKAKSGVTLAASITKQLQFKPYLPAADSGLLKTLEIDQSSISFQSNVLIFQATVADKTLAISEQATPKDFDMTALKADREFAALSGKAYITDGQSRTTGALFTSDGTWVLINAPDPIGADTMQALINSFTKTN